MNTAAFDHETNIRKISDPAMQHLVRIAVGIVACIGESRSSTRHGDRLMALRIVLAQTSDELGRTIDDNP